MEKSAVNIGKSVVIKGELNGSEDLTIEGQVEGKIELRQNVLTIGPNGRIKAQVFAKSVVVLGEVTGNVTASEKVDIRDNGSVDGDIAAPRVAIAEGAHFRGSIDMQKAGAQGCAKPKAEAKPAAPPGRRRPPRLGRFGNRGRAGHRYRCPPPLSRVRCIPHQCSPTCLKWGAKRPDSVRRGCGSVLAQRRRTGHRLEGVSEVPHRAVRSSRLRSCSTSAR